MAESTEIVRVPLLRAKAFWAGFLIGMGVMAAIDEIVFHQVLGWHHFYDRSTPQVGLLSDGILHALELVALAAGFFLLLQARHRSDFSWSVAWSGLFVGSGLFQLLDGTVNHKVLRVHQIRYEVELLPYDLAWIASAVVLTGIGATLAIMAVRRRPQRHR